MTETLSDARRRATDALNKLARLGQSQHALTILNEATGSVTYDHITGNAELSDAGKRRHVSSRYIAQMRQVADKLDAAATRFGRQDADDAATTFGIEGLTGDRASLSVSLRDAADRVSAQNDPIELQRMLARATRTSDETMARAIADHALTLGDHDTVNAFVATRPQHAPSVERLWANTHRKTTTADTLTHWQMAALKPEALGGLQDYEVDAAAISEGQPT